VCAPRERVEVERKGKVLQHPVAKRPEPIAGDLGNVLLELTVAEQRFNAVMEVIRDGLTVIEAQRQLTRSAADQATSR
jgi:hypothetical protein